MADPQFRSLGEVTDDSVAELCSMSPAADRVTDWVAGMLVRGEIRPERCRLAVSPSGRPLAAHSFFGAPVPVLVDLLGHVDADAAAALLRHDLDVFALDAIECQLVAPDDASGPLRRLRESERQVLDAVGFDLLADRVRVEWLPAAGVPTVRGALAFRPASTFDRETLVEVFASVGDGSLDAHMISGRARLGRIGEAAERLAHSAAMRHEDPMFAIGVDADGVAVGYVLGALVGDDRPVLAEIGVVASRRGRGYVDDLLAHGTAGLARRQPAQIRGDVDAANTPMRAAFARAGFTEFAVRQDYRWTRSAG